MGWPRHRNGSARPRVLARAGRIFFSSAAVIVIRAGALWLGPGLPALNGLESSIRTPEVPVLSAKKSSGLQLTIQSSTRPNAVSDKRVARLAALAVDVGENPSVFTLPGPFRATWEGEVTVRQRGDYTFAADGFGKIEITVAGKIVCSGEGDDLLKLSAVPVALNRGANPIKVVYESDARGAAQIRLLWSGKGFAPESPAPNLFTHQASDPSERLDLLRRHGREMVFEKHCLDCHAPPESDEFARLSTRPDAAPDLHGIGERVNQTWLLHWLEDPRSVRSDTAMPRLLHGEEAVNHQDAADLAAFLTTLRNRSENVILLPAANSTGSTSEGAKIFANLGCAACHALPNTAQGDRISLTYVRAKWKTPALAAFLQQPNRFQAGIRMPNFHLNEKEATDLAAFLGAATQDFPATGAVAASVASAERGRARAAQLGCFACHRGLGENQLAAPSLTKILLGDGAKGCLAVDEAHRGAAPDFAFSEPERQAVLAFAATDWTALTHRNRAEWAENRMAELRCYACHSHDNKTPELTTHADEVAQLLAQYPASANNAHEEESALEQNAPDLTWVGEKLQASWIKRQLTTDTPSARPWLKLRMPAFPDDAETFSDNLPAVYGLAKEDTPRDRVDSEKAAIGQKIASPDGFACNACHAMGTTPALAPFGAPGINFALVPHRLRTAYYFRWVLDPLRIDPATRMPKFAQENGKTTLSAVYDGEARQQFASILEYMRSLSADEKLSE